MSPVERAFDGVRRLLWNEEFFNTGFGDHAGVSWFADYLFTKLVTYSCPSVKFSKIESDFIPQLYIMNVGVPILVQFLIFH